MTETMEQNAVKAMRQPTLETLGLGTVLDIFRNGRLPVDPAAAVDAVFGPAGDRGAIGGSRHQARDAGFILYY